MFMIDFVKVGMKIIKYRKQNNLTQDDIASKLYVSRQLVSKWENGTGIPSIDVLLELSKMFHITFEELLCLNEKNTIDEDNIFAGKDRMYVITSIIRGDIQVNLPDVFYQFSNYERMIILKAIKDGELKVNEKNLYPKLTNAEQIYLRKEKRI